MSTADQTHSARIHGEALVAAERLVANPALGPLLRRLAGVTLSPHDHQAQAVGDIAGEAFADLPHGGGDVGNRLLAAGLLLVTGVIAYDRPEPAVRAAAYEHASDQ